MTRKNLLFKSLIAAGLIAGGVALAQPFAQAGHGAPRWMAIAGAEAGDRHVGRGPGWRQVQHAEGGMKGQGMQGQGMRGRQGMGMGRGMGGHAAGPDAAEPGEMRDIRAMFMQNDDIQRSVENLPNGIRTVTESDDPQLADVIRRHVAEMGQRIEEGRDPGLPIESAELRFLFEARDSITSHYEPTERGIIVVQTSDDPAVIAALQKHAADVSDLAERGRVAAREAVMRNRSGAAAR